jgi:hypothetical protein
MADSGFRSYSQAPEIRAYFQKVAKAFDLEKYVRLNHQVVMARWDQSGQQWRLEVKNTTTGEVSSDTADFLINGGGIIKCVSISYLSSSYPGTSGGTNARFPAIGSGPASKDWILLKEGCSIQLLGILKSTARTRRLLSLAMVQVEFKLLPRSQQVSCKFKLNIPARG